jgi:hypothetical protein
MVLESIECAVADISIENGILFVEYKKGYLDLEGAKLTVKKRLELADGREFPVLVNDQGITGMSKEARDYFSSSKGTVGLKAGGIISKSVFTTAIANFYLKVSRPGIPARMFTSRQKAIEWLSKYK